MVKVAIPINGTETGLTGISEDRVLGGEAMSADVLGVESGGGENHLGKAAGLQSHKDSLIGQVKNN